jgi:hypothetical protein
VGQAAQLPKLSVNCDHCLLCGWRAANAQPLGCSFPFIRKLSGMKPLEYLLLQMELEGIKKISSHLITRMSQDIDDFPLVLFACTSDGESLVCFDDLIAEEIRSNLSKDDLPAFKVESAIEVFKQYGVSTKASHFKTYVFPDRVRPVNTETVKCFSQDDPKIIAFGFNGLSDKVFAIENEGAIVSACVSSRQNSKSAEVWVFTHPDHRQKGLALQVVMAWARNMRKEGLVPFYSHDIENTNSAFLAKRLNLIQVFEETVIEKVS